MNGTGRWGIILLAWAGLYAMSLASHTLLPIDETRYVTVAWSMWQRGDFLLPWLNGGPYSDKPPLLFWLIHAGWAVTGVNEWWPRIGPGLTGLLAVALTQRLARRLWPDDPHAAHWTPPLLLGCLWWTLFASATMFDMLVAASTVGAMLGLLQAADGQRRRGFLLTGIALGLGLLAKGPTTLLQVLPAALLAPWWSGRGSQPWLRWYGGVLGALALAASLILAWAIPAALRGGPHYAHMIFWGQTAHRMVDSFAHQAPVWWYVALTPAMVFPWLFWSPTWRALRSMRPSTDRGLRFCMAWGLPVLMAFSLISGKQAHYLLPCLPAFALALARGLTGQPAPLLRRHQIGPALAALLLAASLGMTAPLASRLGGAAWLTDVSQLGGLALAGWGVVLLLPRRPRLETALYLVAGLSMVTVLTADWAVIRAAKDAYDLRPIAHYLKQLEHQGLPVAHLGKYHGQFQFLGRLQRSPEVLSERQVATWFERHPQGHLILYFKQAPADLDSAFRQRFAGREVAVLTRQAWLNAQKNND